jgi:hypothetical protein
MGVRHRRFRLIAQPPVISGRALLRVLTRALTRALMRALLRERVAMTDSLRE